MIKQPQSRAVVVTPPQAGSRDKPGWLVDASHTMALDAKHPVALEIAGTAQQKLFCVRAATPEALNHATAQLQARHPQAGVEILPLDQDPFHLESGEIASAIELASADVSLPLRSWNERDRMEEGADPLLGILGALDDLPAQVRVIIQLALAPAPSNWAVPYTRKALEHALEPERQRQMLSRGQGSGPSWTVILLGGLLLAGGMLLKYVHFSLPPILSQALTAALRGRPLTGAETQALITAGTIVFGGFFFLYILIDQVRKRFFPPKPLYDQKLVAQKTHGGAYRVRLRLYAISPVGTSRIEQQVQTQARAGILNRLVSAFRAYHLARGNYFIVRALSQKKAAACLQGEWASDVSRSANLLGGEEVDNLWHLPTGIALTSLALVETRTARTYPLHPALEHAGQGDAIGVCDHAGQRISFRLTHGCTRTHGLVVGISGSGKSTLLKQIAIRGMQEGAFICLDPHDDLASDLLGLVPEERAKDVVLIDFADLEYAVGLNFLDATQGQLRDKAVDDLMRAFSQVWASSWGPRMENAFRAALRTLFALNEQLVKADKQRGPDQQYTLLDIFPLLTEHSYRNSLLEQVTDPFLIQWWKKYYDGVLYGHLRQEVITPVLSKVTTFESEVMRRVIGQSRSTLQFAELISGSKILLVKLAKETVGADVSGVLGATVLSLLERAIAEQGKLSLDKRVQMQLMLDEFQVYAGVDHGAIAELRKYGAAIMLATQDLEYLRKLDPTLRNRIFANIQQIFCFRLSNEDAKILAGELGISAEEVTMLDLYMCYARLTEHTHRYPPFSLRLAQPHLPATAEDQATAIGKRCRKEYALPAALADAIAQQAIDRIKNVVSAADTSGIRTYVQAIWGEEAVLDPPTSTGAAPQPTTAPTSSAAAPSKPTSQPNGQASQGKGRSKKGKEPPPDATTPDAWQLSFSEVEKEQRV